MVKPSTHPDNHSQIDKNRSPVISPKNQISNAVSEIRDYGPAKLGYSSDVKQPAAKKAKRRIKIVKGERATDTPVVKASRSTRESPSHQQQGNRLASIPFTSVALGSMLIAAFIYYGFQLNTRMQVMETELISLKEELAGLQNPSQ